MKGLMELGLPSFLALWGFQFHLAGVDLGFVQSKGVGGVALLALGFLEHTPERWSPLHRDTTPPPSYTQFFRGTMHQ